MFLPKNKKLKKQKKKTVKVPLKDESVEKAVAKWSFMSNIPSKQKDQPEPSLKTFICKLKTKHGLSSRCQDLGINAYKVSVLCKRTLQNKTIQRAGYSLLTLKNNLIVLTQILQRS